MKSPSSVLAVSHSPRFFFSKNFWRLSVFLVTGFLIGGFWASILAIILSLGSKLLIIGIGIPILFLSLLFAKFVAYTERARIELFLGIHITSTYRQLPANGWWQRTLAFISDPAVWRDLLYALLLFPLSFLDFCILVLTFFAPLGLLAAIPQLFIDAWWKAVIVVLISVLIFWGGVYLVVAMSRLHGIVARNLLGIPVSARLAALTQSRKQLLSAAIAERQRIARDLHDGAQQNLLTVAMDLGMAKEKLDSNPEEARALIAKAHDQAKRSLTELRDVVQGIYPAILTDRGLDAALSSLAGRCSVPVTVTYHLAKRLPELLESTAYFFVAEALTNIAKHSGATAATVTISQSEGNLIIEVSDNGQGGATTAQGTGLTGLRDRVAVLDGDLIIDSPPSGPTTLRGVLPCAL